MSVRKLTLFIVFYSLTQLCFSQSVQDKIFSLEEFIELVKANHPIAKQANIQIKKAEADALSAKGNFDPNFSIDFSRKTFDGKNYYDYFNPELKIPLPIGDIKTGIENNGGSNTKSELTLGKSSYFGIELPLAKGLLMDKRRALVKQTKIFIQQSEQEKIQTVNNLLFDAYVTYAKWAGEFQLYNLYSKYVDISAQRLKLLRIAERNGDKSVMDTLESYTQLQNLQLLQSQSQLNLFNAVLEVSNYLWLQNDTAFLLAQNVTPNIAIFSDIVFSENLINYLNQSLIDNPILKNYNFKLDVLEVERKLKAQNLLPTLNTKVNLLNSDYAVFNGFNSNLFQNNNRLGLDFKMPLFLREARGDYKKAKLKIEETNLEFSLKRWELENKIKSYHNEYVLLKQQLSTALSAYNNYSNLYNNELLRFNNGESSLFILNARENKALEFFQKTVELRVKLFKSRYAIDWAAGRLR